MLLALGIPTYNRAETLHITLTRLAQQIQQSGLQDVEIIVSDNCSTDHTPAVCSEVAARFPEVSLRYFRNSDNIGFDRNVDVLFNHAAATYVWTLSDDDHLSETAVADVRSLLEKRDVNFAFVNYDVSVDGKIMGSRYGTGPTQWIDGRDLLKTIRFSNSLISSSIFKRQAWRVSQPDKHFGSLWIHFFVAREVLMRGTGLIIGEKMVRMMQSGLHKSRAEKRHESSDQIEFYMQAHLKFVEYAHELLRYNYDRETFKLAQSIGEREDIHQVINFKLTARGYEFPQLLKIWRRLHHYRFTTLRFWCVTTPLLLAPNGIVKSLRAVFRIVRS